MNDKSDSSSCSISFPLHLQSADFKLAKQKIQTMLLLRFNTLGCLVNSLEPEYLTYFGEELDWKKLGFPSLLEMLEKMTMEVSLSQVSGRNSKVVHAQPLDHQTTLTLLQLFTLDPNQIAKQVPANDQPLRKKPRNNQHFINSEVNTFRNGVQNDNQNQNSSVPNSEPGIQIHQEKEGASSKINSNSNQSSKLADKILVKIEHHSPTFKNTSTQHNLSSSSSSEASVSQRKSEEPRKSGRERHSVPAFHPHTNSKSTPKTTTKPTKKGEQKKPSVTPSSESKSLSGVLKIIELELGAKRSGPVLEQAWLSIFDMTIEEPDLDVLLKVTELFTECLDTFSNKHKLLEFMLGALGNIIMDDELRRTLMLSTEIPRVLFELLASPKWTRINFKIEFSVVELLIAFLSDGNENWKFENFSRTYVCSKIQSIITKKWDLGTDLIVKDFHYNSLESNVNLLAADHTPVCQLWSAWTLANFTQKRPELYVKKLEKQNGVKALESLISKSHGKEMKKYAQIALDALSSDD